MDTPVLLMVNVILWSTGLSVVALAVLLGLDWLESRRTQGNADLQADARLDALMQKRLQQATPVSSRRRAAAANQVTAKAA
ncbi:hypothetical protein [Nevskia soli]|uniref:hypothetical protein n=1 Tax=Nevskia soli TaxID=418856 RepID=UPI0012F86990|nr:hypothetical protein [Nevskia soli]